MRLSRLLQRVFASIFGERESRNTAAVVRDQEVRGHSRGREDAGGGEDRELHCGGWRWRWSGGGVEACREEDDELIYDVHPTDTSFSRL